MQTLMTKDDIQGCWTILPTPAKPNGSDWREKDTVDHDETARIINALIDAGVNGLFSLGTFGECATLTWQEKRAFIQTCVDTIAGRIPFFCGTTALNTRDVIEQTRIAVDIGVDGTMLGVPMWCAIDTPAAFAFYEDVAEACPTTAICVYANPEAFKFTFPRPFWAAVDKIRQVICAKYLNIAQLNTDLRLAPSIRFVPVDADFYPAARIAPDEITAFWSSGALCGPTAALLLRDEVAKARRTHDWTAAKAIANRMADADRGFFPKGEFAEFSRYNIGLEKIRMNAAGWLNAGPMRPPYHIVPDDYREGARRSGEAWARLNAELAREAEACVSGAA